MRFISRWMAVAAVACVCGGSGYAAEELAKVGTAGELRAVPVAHLDSGWDVRLGYGESGAEGGPWVIVYCEAKYVGEEGAARGMSERAGFSVLGPVMVKAEWQAVASAKSIDKMLAAPLRDGLYGVTVPIHIGTCTINVEDEKGKLVAQKTLDFPDAPAPVRPTEWQTFAQPYRRGEAQGIRVAGVDEQPARVRIEGRRPLEDLEARLQAWADRVESFKNAALPGMMPTDALWFAQPAPPNGVAFYPLKLTLEDGRFVIRTDGRKVDAWPCDYVLARWWVNGAPVTPEPRPGTSPDEARQVEARQVVEADTMRVDFGYPASLGAAKQGDKIALQVVYSPDGFDLRDEQLQKLQMAVLRGVEGMPMLSNRLEFTLSKELLALREKNLAP